MDWILRHVGVVGIALAFVGTLLVLFGAALDHWRLYPAGKGTVSYQTTERGVTIPPHHAWFPGSVPFPTDDIGRAWAKAHPEFYEQQRRRIEQHQGPLWRKIP